MAAVPSMHSSTSSLGSFLTMSGNEPVVTSPAHYYKPDQVMTKTQHPPPGMYRLDFQAHGKGESYIFLGHHKNKGSNVEPYKNTFLSHPASLQNLPTENYGSSTMSSSSGKMVSSGSLDQTRFHKGFQRRREADIENVIADEGKRFAKEYAEKSAKLAQERSKMLRTIDARTGYNIITGNENPDNTRRLEQRASKKSVPNAGLGPEAPLRGHNTLKDSTSRFFLPQYSGPKHEYRQQVQVKEGLHAPHRYSSELGIGRKNLVTYGVEDQFSKSQYRAMAPAAKTGLVEKREPGKYTPRKIGYNPSGDPQALGKWTRSGDLSGETLRKTRVSD